MQACIVAPELTYVEVSDFRDSSQPQSPHNMVLSNPRYCMHTVLHAYPPSLLHLSASAFGSFLRTAVPLWLFGLFGEEQHCILKRACSLTGWLYMRSALHSVLIPPFGSTSMACRSRRTMSNGLLRRGTDFLRIITCLLSIGRSRIGLSAKNISDSLLSQSLISDVWKIIFLPICLGYFTPEHFPSPIFLFPSMSSPSRSMSFNSTTTVHIL